MAMDECKKEDMKRYHMLAQFGVKDLETSDDLITRSLLRKEKKERKKNKRYTILVDH